MDEKKRVQEALNRSLSGLREDPYLAQRVIAQAKGEKKVKRSSLRVLALALVLALAVAGGAYALLSSQAAEFFGKHYGQEWGDWLQGGKIAQLSETVTLDDVTVTLDEVVYRDRGIYGVGTVKAVNESDVLISEDSADLLEMGEEYAGYHDAQALAEEARMKGGKLLTVTALPVKLGVDEGTMIVPGSIGYYDVRNADGSLTFSFMVEDGYALEEGKTYQMEIYVRAEAIDENGQTEKRQEYTGTVSFQPVVMAESVNTAAPTPVTVPAVSGYEVTAPAAYSENGTMPVYRATETDLIKAVDPKWFNGSGIAEKRSESSFVFGDGAMLQYSADFLNYVQYTDEMYDYNTYLRERFGEDAESMMLPVPDLSDFIASMASGVHFGYAYGQGETLEKRQLTFLSLSDAEKTAEEMIAKLGLNGYACSYALDMSAERIHTLGEKYNRFFYETEENCTNQPRMDYGKATAEDEGYYLVYTLMGIEDASDTRNLISLFIDRSGIAYMNLRNTYTMGEKLHTPDALITPDEAIAVLNAEAASAIHGKPAESVQSVKMIYRAVRAENKADGMVFVPVWHITYQDADHISTDHSCWAQINAVNGKLTDAIF